MLVLHLAACDDQFYLWGEASSARRGDEEPATADDAILPFHAAPEALREALGRANYPLDAEPAIALTAWLPTRGDVPLPSSPLIADPPEEGSLRIAPWQIRVLPLSTAQAISFLEAGAGRELLAPGLLLAPDARFWMRVLHLARVLVAREQFLPGLAERPDGWEARWEPVVTGDDAVRLAQLAAAMPHACRALAPVAKAPPDHAPAAVLTGVIGRFVDHLVRTALPGRAPLRARAAPAFASLHDAWLHALRAPTGVLTGRPAELAELHEQIRAWRRRISALAGAPFRLAFRLEEPEPDEPSAGGLASPAGRWFVRYLLQAVDDPSLLVDVADAWEPDRATAALFERRDFDAYGYLLTALGQAVSVFPAMEASLKQPGPGGCPLDAAEAYAFLTQTAGMLRQAGFGLQLPAWWTRRGAAQRLSARASVRSPKMQASGGLSLDTVVAFDWQVALGGEPLSREELEALARLKAPLVRLRGQWVEVDPAAIQKALDFWKKQAGGEVALRDVLRMALGAAEAPGGLPIEGVDADGWVGELLGRLSDAASVELLPAPEGFEGTLRPYQVRGYSWMAFLRRWDLGACLADDMGLGKTIQTLALVQQVWEANGRKPVLLVCPTSVMGNWQKEAARFTPGLPVLLHHGTRRTKQDTDFKRAAQQQAIVLTGYPLLHRDLDLLKQIRWGAVILDEAQNVKNPETKQAKAARALKADHRIALTGTPVENNVGELWSILEFLNPGFLGSQAQFKRRFFAPIQNEGDEEAMRRLKRLTGPFILRRLKTDRTVISDLPEKLEMNVFTTLTKEQASLYKAVVKDLTAALDAGSEGIERKGLVLATLVKLKQICNHPAQFLHDASAIAGRSGKLARLVEMLEEVYETGDRALLFTQFTEMGEILKQHLQETFGREVLFLHGGVPRQQRERLVERFQQEEAGPPFFVLSLKAGGTGLNLTRASHVFHFDRWWNPAVENQATDRAFRIGQTRRVQVHKFVSIGTVEERIDEMIERKRAVAENVVGTGEDWITELSTRELKQLFKLRQEAVADV